MKNNARVEQIVAAIGQEFHRIFDDTASLIWFGSWVKGDAYAQSDIDLAIKGSAALDDEKVLTFQQYLADFPTLYKIDLVDMRYVGDLLKKEIDRYGRPI